MNEGGIPREPEQPPDEGTPGEQAGSAADSEIEAKVKRGCLGCLGTIVAIATLAAACNAIGGGGASGGGSPERQRIGAINVCEDWVRDQLKAPSTAEFSNTQVRGSGPWTITGEVDAQNSFGAMIRAGWTCEIRLDGDTFRGRAQLLE